MTAQVRGDNMHGLPKEAQLVEPLPGTAAITMDKEERRGRTLGVIIDRVYVDDADTPWGLRMTSSGRIDDTAVEFDVESHVLPLFQSTWHPRGPIHPSTPPRATTFCRAPVPTGVAGRFSISSAAFRAPVRPTAAVASVGGRSQP